jgi:hypothetical protein
MATPLLLFYQTKKLTIKAVTNAKKQQPNIPNQRSAPECWFIDLP